MKTFTPAPYVVYVTTPKGALRCGAADTVEDARKMIAEEKRACGNTFGGLIDPVDTKGFGYKIFKATWEVIQ